jgi:peptide/nickel transport system permease protein
MLKFLISRLAQALATLILVSFVIFILGRITGSPVDTILPLDASDEDRSALIEELGLDRPVLYQYWIYVKGAIRGDFGTSLRTGRPVGELVFPRLWNSLRLAGAAMLFTILLSMPLGVIAAINRGRIWDKLALSVALLGQSIPTFWTGIVAVLLFSVTLGVLPTSGIGGWQYYVLPAITLGWFTSAGTVRLLRSSMLEVLDSEYIKLARIKGVPNHQVIWKHAFRNALVPVVTFVGLMFGVIIAAAVTTEVVFSWPGLGRLAYEAVLWRDFPLLQFTIITWTLVVITINFLVDVMYVLIDPRIRL